MRSWRYARNTRNHCDTGTHFARALNDPRFAASQLRGLTSRTQLEARSVCGTRFTRVILRYKSPGDTLVTLVMIGSAASHCVR